MVLAAKNLRAHRQEGRMSAADHFSLLTCETYEAQFSPFYSSYVAQNLTG